MSNDKKMNDKKLAARRDFLRKTAFIGTATPFALNLAALGASANLQAATSNDYKALVCLFMLGGNDSANTVLATDSDSWAQYQAVRVTPGGESIDLPAVGSPNGVLAIDTKTSQAGRSFALHPNLEPLRALYDLERVAILANVGPLIVPTTKEQYKTSAVPLPPKLFSHNDQQSIWQAYGPEGAAFGWGGRIGDIVASQNSTAYFTAISASGNAVFMTGRNVKQYQVSSAGAVPIAGLDSIFNMPSATCPYRSIISDDRTNFLEKEHAAVVKRSIDAQALLAGAILPAGIGGVPTPTQYTVPSTGALANNPLAVQLQTVARVIGGRVTLGVKRQVFYVSMGGFDTHDGQKLAHADLMARIAHAINYFDEVMGNLQGVDLRAQVTTFTASDFGRTFTSNGDGTDHGWGGHHFIHGGAVKGKDIYGTFPATSLGHSQDVSSGSLLPQYSVEQYGGTLAKWFGLSAADVVDVFPNIVNFNSRDLGFMV